MRKRLQLARTGNYASAVIVLAILAFILSPSAQTTFSGKVSGGFTAPANTDSDGRRHVIKGKDMESRGNNLLELSEPRVTRYNADDTADMFIESGRCFYQTKAGLAYSPTNLVVRTADARFSIEGVGWTWDLSGSLLTISNQVVALVQKTAISGAGSKATNMIRVTSVRFRQEGDAASFLDQVVVKDGEDTLRCDRLNIQFVKPGGAQRIEAVGNVDLEQTDTRIQSGHAVYDVKDNIIRISEHPNWIVNKREGSADLVTIQRTNDTLAAEGHVYMKLPMTNLVLAADSNTNAPATNRFVEIRSERFQYQNFRTNRSATAVYTGKVQATQADATLLCEQLTANFASSNRLSRLHAEGEVQINSVKNRVFGREADYDLEGEKVTILGDPHWELDQTKGRSETLVLLPKTKEIRALRNVEMIVPGRSLGAVFAAGKLTNELSQTNSPLTITADSLSHSEKVSIFEKDVLVADARGTIRCALLTLHSGQSNQLERIVAERNVVIRQPELAAFGDRAEYEQATGLVRLTGDPELHGPGKHLHANMFVIDRNRNTFSVSPGKYRIQLQLKSKTPLVSP